MCLEVDVLEDVRIVDVNNWKKLAQNRVSWKKVVERARTYIGCSAMGEEVLFPSTSELLNSPEVGDSFSNL
jgi:hypothetical protein